MLLGRPAAAADDPIASLRTYHPRLYLSERDLDILRDRATSDPLLDEAIGLLLRDATAALGIGFPQEIDYGYRMLTDVARRFVQKIRPLALAYRLTGDSRYLRKAEQFMLATARLRDWNHDTKFLATSEITLSIALGYDWLYDGLGPTSREVIRHAIIEKGLKQSLPFYIGRATVGDTKWPRVRTNHNHVCNAGMIVGALAVADEAPEVASRILRHALSSLRIGLQGYAPDGGWEEGPHYWEYATRHTAYAIAALDGALGSDFGLAEARGLRRTGYFYVHSIDPNGRYFNFGDSITGAPATPGLAWLARKFGDPVLAGNHRRSLQRGLATISARPHDPFRSMFRGVTELPFHIVWLADRGLASNAQPLPLDAFVDGTARVITMRGAWHDPNASYAGVIAGSNAKGHGHRDLGSFVFTANGVRWAVDGGFSGGAATIHHNTLSLGGRDQWHKGSSAVVAFHSRPRRAHAIIDLSNAYGRRTQISVLRGVALVNRRGLLVQDEISNLSKKNTVIWSMLTVARVQADGRQARLTRRGKTLRAEILHPPWARFRPGLPKGRGDPRDIPRNRNLLTVTVSGRRGSAVRLAIALTPTEPAGEQIPIAVRPLASWEGYFARPRSAQPRTRGAAPLVQPRGRRDVCDSDKIIDRILCRQRGG